MRTWARMVTAGGQRAFVYQFTHVPPGPRAKEWGAYHAAEISYVFGNLRNPTFAYTDVDRRLSDQMSTYWVNFAAAGDPNRGGNASKAPAGSIKWSPYDLASEAYLDLGDTLVMKNHLLKAQLDFLEQFQQRRQTSQ
jgi:para-nitrobenzyl esterase